MTPGPARAGACALAPVTRTGAPRRQALCRWGSWEPTGTWAASHPACTLPRRACGSALSAPSLRLPLCRQALVPSAFRLRSGGCPRGDPPNPLPIPRGDGVRYGGAPRGTSGRWQASAAGPCSARFGRAVGLRSPPHDSAACLGVPSAHPAEGHPLLRRLGLKFLVFLSRSYLLGD